MAGSFEIWASGKLTREALPHQVLRKAKILFPSASAEQLARLISGGPSMAALADTPEAAARMAEAMISVGIDAQVRMHRPDAPALAQLSTADTPPPAAHVAAPELPAEEQATLRVILGLLIVIFGGILLSHSLLGLPAIAGGGWLATGRSLSELRSGVTENSRSLLNWALGLVFFFGAIYQASDALLPMLPLFAISALLLPPWRDAVFAVTRRRMSPAMREVLIVLLLWTYAWLVSQVQAERIMAVKQAAWRAMTEDRKKAERSDPDYLRRTE